jgi:hypothetical protein
LELEPHLVHPSRCKAIASARLKNDKVDAATLAQLLRADLLPEAWIAPQQVRICVSGLSRGHETSRRDSDVQTTQRRGYPEP